MINLKLLQVELEQFEKEFPGSYWCVFEENLFHYLIFVEDVCVGFRIVSFKGGVGISLAAFIKPEHRRKGYWINSAKLAYSHGIIGTVCSPPSHLENALCDAGIPFS